MKGFTYNTLYHDTSLSATMSKRIFKYIGKLQTDYVRDHNKNINTDKLSKQFFQQLTTCFFSTPFIQENSISTNVPLSNGNLYTLCFGTYRAVDTSGVLYASLLTEAELDKLIANKNSSLEYMLTSKNFLPVAVLYFLCYRTINIDTVERELYDKIKESLFKTPNYLTNDIFYLIALYHYGFPIEKISSIIYSFYHSDMAKDLDETDSAYFEMALYYFSKEKMEILNELRIQV